MKKLLLLAAMALAVNMVWGVDDSSEANSYTCDIGYDPLPLPLNDVSLVRKSIGTNFTGKDVKFFAGYDPVKQLLGSGLTGMNNAEVQGIRNGVWSNSNRNAYRLTKAPANYSVIGYSQGGLRALGYLTRLKASYPSDITKIDAVVTISGSDLGAKFLEGGFINFKNKLMGKVNIVNNGSTACVASGIPLFGVVPPGLPLTRVTNGSDFLLAISPPQIRSFMELAFKTVVGAISQPIVDMAPESDYIAQNVAKIEKYSYKVKTGSEFTVEIRYNTILGIKIPYVWAGMKDVYKYYTANKVTPKFDSAVPVGFIVGKNSNTISIAGSNESVIRGFIKAAEVQFGIAQGIQTSLVAVTLGLPSPFMVFMNDANRARQMMANIDSEINDLKGSTTNDGLLAVESQYISTTFTKPDTKATETVMKNPVLGSTTTGYIEKPNYTHKSIVENADTFKSSNDLIKLGFDERVKQKLR